MPDVEQRIRDSRPPLEAAADLDVEGLVQRARRRRVATRSTAAVGVAAVVAAVGLSVSALLPHPDLDILPADRPPTEPAEEATTPPRPLGEGEVLERPTPGEVAAAAASRPTSPVCSTTEGPTGTATITVAAPPASLRCFQVLPGQTIRIVNRTGGSSRRATPTGVAAGTSPPSAGTSSEGTTFTASLGGYVVRLDPAEEVLLDLPVSSYLAPGVHRITSDFGPAQAEVWVLQTPAVSAGQQEPLDALRAFATDPSDATFTGLPLADEVALGTVRGTRAAIAPTTRAAADLRDPAAWQVDGTSALGLLAEHRGELIATVGARPHCGGRAPAPPHDLAQLTRLSLQPPATDDCEGWFAIDVYVEDGGTGLIHAVIVARV